MMGRMGATILLLTTTGRRSRRERTVPALYREDGGRFVIVASLAGPAAASSLVCDLEAIRGKAAGAKPALRCHCLARKRRGKGAARPRLVAMYPAYEGYQNRTTRDIPVVIATPA